MFLNLAHSKPSLTWPLGMLYTLDLFLLKTFFLLVFQRSRLDDPPWSPFLFCFLHGTPICYCVQTVTLAFSHSLPWLHLHLKVNDYWNYVSILANLQTPKPQAQLPPLAYSHRSWLICRKLDSPPSFSNLPFLLCSHLSVIPPFEHPWLLNCSLIPIITHLVKDTLFFDTSWIHPLLLPLSWCWHKLSPGLLQLVSKIVSWLPVFSTCNPFPALLFVIWFLPTSPDLSPVISSLGSSSYTLQLYWMACIALNGPHFYASCCPLGLVHSPSMSFALKTSFVLLDSVQYCLPSGFP